MLLPRLLDLCLGKEFCAKLRIIHFHGETSVCAPIQPALALPPQGHSDSFQLICANE